MAESKDPENTILMELKDGTVTIGITDHAQEALGDVVFVELPGVGDSLAAGDEAGERGPTLLAGRQLPRRDVGEPPGDPHSLHRSLDLGIARADGRTPEPDVLGDGEVGVFRTAPLRTGTGTPGLGLGIQLIEIRPLPPGKEGIPDIAYRPLHAALLIAARHRNGSGLEAVVR